MKAATQYSAIILAIALTSCTSTETTLGVMAPLTGNAAELGQHIQRGIELTDTDYKLIYEDTKCIDTKASSTAAQKLATIDKVDFVIGPLCAPAYQAATGIFNQYNIPFIHTSAVTDAFIATSGEYGIPGISTTIDDEAGFLAKYVYNQRIEKMALLMFNTDWGHEHRAGFTEEYERLGGHITIDETFEITESDFRTIAQKLEKADGVYIVALNFQMADIVKQIRTVSDIPIFGQFEIEDPAFLDAAGEAAFGIQYVYPKVAQTPETEAFQQEYRARYGTEPNYYSYIAYDTVRLFEQAKQQCTTSRCITETILQTSDYPGVSGTITFSDKEIQREFEIRTISPPSSTASQK